MRKTGKGFFIAIQAVVFLAIIFAIFGAAAILAVALIPGFVMGAKRGVNEFLDREIENPDDVDEQKLKDISPDQ